MGRRKINYTTQITKKWLIALYIRLSKEDGNDVSYSIKNQKARLLKEVEELNKIFVDEEYIVVDVFIDDGFTGTDSNRNDFQRMLKAIDNKEVNCVIVKDLSRLSRNYIECGEYLEYYFVKNNIRFISLELPTLDSYKNPDGMNSIMVPIQSVFNDNFARETSQKIRSVFNRKRRDGEFIGAFAPYGYQKNPGNKNHLIVDETVAPVIKDIFKWFNTGMSKRAISKKLNDLSIPGPTAYKKSLGLKYKNPNDKYNSILWNARTVDSILKNQMYIGDMVQGKQKVVSYKIHKQIKTPEEEWFVIAGTHEPIISSEEYKKTQELLARDTKTVNHKHETYLFSGFLRCYDCEHAMRRKRGGNKKDVYYVCRTYNDLSKTACSSHTIREEIIEKLVLGLINAHLKIVDDIYKMIDDVESSPANKNSIIQLERSVSLKEHEIGKLNQIRDNLYNDWRSEIITKEDYLRLRQSYDEQLEAIKNSLSDLRNELLSLKEGINISSPFFTIYKEYKQVEKLDRNLLLKLIDYIHIKENKEVYIEFKFQDQLKHIRNLLNQEQAKQRK